jgi:hypothetical protein
MIQLGLEQPARFTHEMLFPHEKHRVTVRLSRGSPRRIEYHSHIIGTFPEHSKKPLPYFGNNIFPDFFHGERPFRNPAFPEDIFNVVDEDYVTVESFLRKAFKRNRTWYASEVADALGMDYLQVREIIAHMISEGKLSVKRS